MRAWLQQNWSRFRASAAEVASRDRLDREISGYDLGGA